MWAGALALIFVAACAADAGDPTKTTSDESRGSVSPDGSGGLTGDDADLGSDTQAPEMETGAGEDAGTPPPVDAGQSGGQPEAASEASTGMDASGAPETSVGDGGCNLQNIPAACPNCKTQNASDVPNCQTFLACFATNNCNPSTACGSNDGVCGVNKHPGGNAPYAAAVDTYNCACP